MQIREMRKTVYLVILLVVSAYCEKRDGGHHSHQNNHHDCKEKDCEVVAQAIENIGMYFDRHLCHAFKHVHCENHVLQHDEAVCGSDGHTYNNHCLFAQARCKLILDDHNYFHHALAHPLNIAGYGACFQSTVSTATTSTSGSLTMAAIAAGGGSTTHHATASTKPQTTTMIMTTTKPTASTTAIPTTTATTMSMHNLLGSVFCQYKTSVVCSPTFSIVCGSDGKYYPNSCELLKVQCDDPQLRIQPDLSQCSLNP